MGPSGQKIKLNKTQLRKERQRQQRIQEKQQQLQKAQQKKKKPAQNRKKLQVRNLLNNSLLFGSAAIDHILLDAGFAPNVTLEKFSFENLAPLFESFQKFEVFCLFFVFCFLFFVFCFLFFVLIF